MQLIAGRTAQEYNERKGRHGAFWEDRYHATAIEADKHLHRCLVYIDLNMVRAGVVSHPVEWVHGGYAEIQKPPKRYAIIDREGLAALCGFTDLRDFKRAHREWIEQALQNGCAPRDNRWSEALAVGSLAFVERVKNELGIKAMHRDVLETDGTYVLREPSEAYACNFTGENEASSSENTLPRNESLENPGT
jgi:putative transposase